MVAEEIKDALLLNQCPPGRYEVKQMIARAEWHRLGEIFRFEPIFTKTVSGKTIIDWRCIPESMANILRSNFKNVSIEKECCPRPGRVTRDDPYNNRKKRHIPSKDFRCISYAEQEGFCYYCERITEWNNWTVDHLTPIARRGQNTAWNKVGCCSTCNGMKSCLTEEEFRATDYLSTLGTNEGGKAVQRLKQKVRDLVEKLGLQEITTK